MYGGGKGAGAGGNFKAERLLSDSINFSFREQLKTGATILIFFSVVMNQCGSHMINV